MNDAMGDAFGLLPSLRPGAGAPCDRPLSKPTAFWHSCALYLRHTHDKVDAGDFNKSQIGDALPWPELHGMR